MERRLIAVGLRYVPGWLILGVHSLLLSCLEGDMERYIYYLHFPEEKADLLSWFSNTSRTTQSVLESKYHWCNFKSLPLGLSNLTYVGQKGREWNSEIISVIKKNVHPISTVIHDLIVYIVAHDVGKILLQMCLQAFLHYLLLCHSIHKNNPLPCKMT